MGVQQVLDVVGDIEHTGVRFKFCGFEHIVREPSGPCSKPVFCIVRIEP